MLHLLILVRKLRANDACQREDICGDPHARCDSGFCRCVPGYSVIDGTCGIKFKQYIPENSVK